MTEQFEFKVGQPVFIRDKSGLVAGNIVEMKGDEAIVNVPRIDKIFKVPTHFLIEVLQGVLYLLEVAEDEEEKGKTYFSNAIVSVGVQLVVEESGMQKEDFNRENLEKAMIKLAIEKGLIKQEEKNKYEVHIGEDLIATYFLAVH
ncbi:hypothetical protein COF68_05260 [Bacillus toyonensis]|uniref:hypothetical protein n=1 Tax=Bacillus toyonensis TaxID=155322 RepID=UPI000BFB4887|nr:hypothetical protein [Bacillus toyonensis]PHE64252.1 hypothetical protein COF68_05260 [Bacillus toyonensis]